MRPVENTDMSAMLEPPTAPATAGMTFLKVRKPELYYGIIKIYLIDVTGAQN